MITIHESHFFLIIILTSIITYISFSIFQSCDINCKVNYYKYENHHQQKEKIHNTASHDQKELPLDDINQEIFQEYKVSTNNRTLVGDKSSAHSSALQGNDINFTDSDAYINKLLNLN
jgi:hypothetical protein